MGWLIDPKERLILIYPKSEQPRSFYRENAELLVPSFAQSLTWTHGEVFGWLKP